MVTKVLHHNPITMDTSLVPAIHFRDDCYRGAFMQGLSTMRLNTFYTDVILKTGDALIPCHKVVLSAASPYFHAMFSSGMSESQKPEIEIQGADTNTILALVNYVYTGEIEITIQNVQNLIQSCDQFQFEGLKQACEKFILQQVDPMNCIGSYKFAKLYGLKLLQEGSRKCMLNRFKEVVQASTEFRDLTEAELVEYISDDRLDVKNEDTVFYSVVSWVRANPEARSENFPNILQNVRLPFCTSAYLCHVVQKEPLMRVSEICQDILEEARCYHMLPEHKHELLCPRVQPRAAFNVDWRLVVIGGLLKDERENRYCWYLKEDSASWELLAQLPRPGWKFYSACALQNGILLTGGYLNNVKHECWLFDTVDKKWKSLPSMLTSRCKHRVVLHGDSVFVIGGEDDLDQPLSSVEKMDVKTRQWTSQSPMKKPLSDPLVVSFGHNIYVFAGIEEDDTSSSCTQVFDTVWDDWHFKAEMPEPCRLGAASAVNDKIFIIGGYTRSCMCYHPLLDTWTVLAGPREKHGNAPVTVWKGKILVGGGDVELNETISVIEAYDPTRNTWSYWKIPLKEELSCHYMLNVDLCGL